MHERTGKETAVQVILYEREMLEHCAKTCNSKRDGWEASRSEEARAEYNLVIEGFLLHFRNLLGFLINKRIAATDLTINHPEQWANGRAVDATLLSKLTDRARDVNTKHALSEKVDCYTKISWFLQHCTEHRYLRHADWDIEIMFADITPVLDVLLRHVGGAPTKPHVVSVGSKGHSTASD